MEIKLEDCITISEQELEELSGTCPKCEGQGQINQHEPMGAYNSMDCPECHGTGQRTFQFEMEGKQCKKCGSDGHLEKWADKKKKNLKDIGICSKCNGSGLLFSLELYEDMEITYNEIPLKVVAAGVSGKQKIIRVIRVP